MTETKSTKAGERTQVPREGQIMVVRGKQCVITRIHPFGTVDVANLVSGKAYRVSGLALIPDGK